MTPPAVTLPGVTLPAAEDITAQTQAQDLTAVPGWQWAVLVVLVVLVVLFLAKRILKLAFVLAIVAGLAALYLYGQSEGWFASLGA